MIGQKKLIQKLNRFNLSTLPHSILLVGERGSEQDELCKYISEKFNLVNFDLTNFITNEYIDEVRSGTTLTLFVINTSNISEREQNILLKFYEEPSSYNYILLLAESDSSVLDTIKTRSYTLRLDTYSKEELEPLVESKEDLDLILQVCKTPGQIELANHVDIHSLYKLCVAIIQSMPSANFSNALSISDKVNFTDEYDKFDLFLFIRMFRFVILENIKTFKDDKCLDYYRYVNDLNKYIWSMSSKLEGRKRLFENFIVSL